MITKSPFLILLLSLSISSLFSQRNPNNNVVSVAQLDPKFTFSIEKRWSGMADSEEYFYFVTNNTADEYMLEIEVDLTLNCYDTKPYKLGFNKKVYLRPNGEFTPKDDWVHSYMITSDREKQKSCLIDSGNYKTLYRGHTWQILSAVNMTQKKAEEARLKLEKEALSNQKKIDEENKRKEIEAEKLKKIEDEKKKNDDLAKQKKEEDTNKNENTSNKNSDKNKANESSSNKSNASGEPSLTKEQELEIAKEKKRVDDELIAEAKAAEAERKREEEERKRQEEEAARQKRQAEYDAWKSTAQTEKNQQDIENATATIGIFTMLGGFIYDGMDIVNPDYTYLEPTKKYTPLFYMTNNLGYSFSIDPILYPSKINTVIGGNDVYEEELKDDFGYYLNLNGESKIGAGNNYYNFYGLISGKIGVVPTLSGMQYAMGFGGGIDFGFKGVKFFGQYKYNVAENKTYSSSDVEESGEAEFDMSSTEMNYGIKFTFGGTAADKYRRGHISIGILEKSFDFEKSGKQYFYDDVTKTLRNTGNLLIDGYSFEWRQDNTFSLFFRYYDSYNYIGKTDNISSANNSIGSPSSFFEIGFVRALDLFTKDRY